MQSKTEMYKCFKTIILNIATTWRTEAFRYIVLFRNTLGLIFFGCKMMLIQCVGQEMAVSGFLYT